MLRHFGRVFPGLFGDQGFGPQQWGRSGYTELPVPPTISDVAEPSALGSQQGS